MCSARPGREKRLKRLLETRRVYRRRCEGCSSAWLAESTDESHTFLVQAVFDDEEVWRRTSEQINTELDSRDGGIESCLAGPPLVGMFKIEGLSELFTQD